jgi:hypothetical protein
VISRAEDPDYGNLTVNTLVRIAAGFDCAFVGRFAPFSELERWYSATADEKVLEVPSFADDNNIISRRLPGRASVLGHASQPELEETQRMPADNLLIMPRRSASQALTRQSASAALAQYAQ